MSNELVPHKLRYELLRWLKAECKESGACKILNAADVIHHFITSVALHERAIHVDLGDGHALPAWKRVKKQKGAACALRDLAKIASETPLNERRWVKMWAELPPKAKEILTAVGWRRDSWIELTFSFPVPNPVAIRPLLPAALVLAASRRGPDRWFQALIAAQIWCVFCEVRKLDVAQPAHAAGGSERIGPIVKFFEMINCLYGGCLRSPLVSVNSGAAFDRVRKRVPKLRN